MMALHYIIEFTKLYIAIFCILGFYKVRTTKKINILVISLLVSCDFGRHLYYGYVFEYWYETFLIGIMAIIVVTWMVKCIRYSLLFTGIYIIICFLDMLFAGLIIIIFAKDVQYIMSNRIYQSC